MMRKALLILELIILSLPIFFCDNLPESAWKEILLDREEIPQILNTPTITYIGDNKLILISGINLAWDSEGDPELYMWEYNIALNEWTRLNFDDEPHPQGRYGHSVAFDGDHTLVLYGGFSFDVVKREHNDTWEFDTNTYTWTEYAFGEDDVKPRDSDGAVWGQMVYIGNNKFIQFGGTGEEQINHYTSNETWEYDPTTHTWREIEVNGNPPREDKVILWLMVIMVKCMYLEEPKHILIQEMIHLNTI